jgi:hypothetical protein
MKTKKQANKSKRKIMLKKKEDIQGCLIWKRQSGLVNLKWKLKDKQKNKKGKENIVKKKEDIQGGLIWKRQSGIVNLKWKLKNKQKNKKRKGKYKERGYTRRFDLI